MTTELKDLDGKELLIRQKSKFEYDAVNDKLNFLEFERDVVPDDISYELIEYYGINVETVYINLPAPITEPVEDFEVKIGKFGEEVTIKVTVEPREARSLKEQRGFAKDDKHYKKMFIWVAAAVNTLLFFLTFIGLGKEMFVFYGESYSYFEVFFTLLAVYNLSSIRSQSPGEVGGILFLDKYLFQTKQGVQYAPLFLCTFRKESALLRNWEIPKDVLHLYPELKGMVKKEDGTEVPIEQVLHLTTKNATDENSKDSIDTGRLTYDATVIVEARLDTSTGAFRQFLERVGDIDTFLRIVDDVVVNYIRKEVIKRIPSQVLEEWKQIERRANRKLEEKIGLSGFAEHSVRVKDFEVPKRVSEQFADSAKAKEAIKAARSDAKSDRLAKKAPLQAVLEVVDSSNGKLSTDQAMKILYQGTISKSFENAKYTYLPQGKGGLMDPVYMMSVMEEVKDEHDDRREEDKKTSKSK